MTILDMEKGTLVSYRGCKAQVVSLDLRYQTISINNMEYPKGNWSSANVPISEIEALPRSDLYGRAHETGN